MHRSMLVHESRGERRPPGREAHGVVQGRRRARLLPAVSPLQPASDCSRTYHQAIAHTHRACAAAAGSSSLP